jgi:hypothetical protein
MYFITLTPVLLFVLLMSVIGTSPTPWDSSGPLTIHWDYSYTPGLKTEPGTIHCTSNGLSITTATLIEKDIWALHEPTKDITVNGITYHATDCLTIKD